MDLYRNGRFTPCGSNEICWEPSRQALSQLATPEAEIPSAAPQPQRSGQRQVVFESEGWEGGACDPVWTHTTIWRDSSGNLHYDTGPGGAPHSRRPGLRGNAPWQYSACTTGEFVYTNSGYCIAFKRDHCHHHQHHEGSVRWARVNGRVGIVRTVETGAKGKPAVNWKAGVDLPPQKPGEVMRHSELSATSKVRLLDGAPKEYRVGGVENSPRVPAPAITAEFHDRDASVQTAAERGANAACSTKQATTTKRAVSAAHAAGGFGGSTGGGGHSGGSSSSGGGSSSASNAASSAASAAAGSHH